MSRLERHPERHLVARIGWLRAAVLGANDGETSKMPVYNGYMTVQELIDIVSFLQPHYDVYVPAYEYRIYP